MKFMLPAILFFTNPLFVFAQQISLQQWNEEAQENIRLLPKYGNHLISLGFKYLYNDIKTAMYRFNQAYLLDSTNTDIYWGFGGVYTRLGDYEKAAKQYKEGLNIDPDNAHLLTDYGTLFMAQSQSPSISESNIYPLLDSAIYFLKKSLLIDAKDQNTSYKLSAVFLFKNDCKNAWKYYRVCKKLGGAPITDEYTRDLQAHCKSKK